MASNRGPNAIGHPTPTSGYNPDRDAYYQPKDSSFSWAQNPSVLGSSRGGVGGAWGSTPSSVGGGVAAAALEPPVGAYNRAGPPPPTGSYGGSGGTAANDGSYERNLISELCPPGGMKAEPPVDKLEQFARILPTLNPDFVCPALLDSLEDGSPWIVRAKALCVIEKTIQVTAHMDPNPYADFFHACIAEIEPLASHTRAAIREPVKRVLKELGLEQGGVETYAPRAPVPTNIAPAPEANLLDFGADEPAPLAPPPAAAPPVAPSAESTYNSSGDSLFGGLKIQRPVALVAAKETAVSVPTEPVAPPVSAVLHPADDGSLLNFLGGNPPKNQPSSTAPISVPSSETSVASDLFSSMSIKENSLATSNISSDATTVQEVSDAAAAGGSAFSFIHAPSSSSTAGVPPATPATTAVPAPTAKESFDPLLSLDWSSKPQQAPNVNAKMQALASYQANMMKIQQMQMQQLMMQQQAKVAMGAGFQVAPGVMSPATQLPSPIHNPSTTVMQANSMRQIPILGQNSSKANANAFSFLRDDVTEKKKQQQQSFDFIKDAMKTAK